MDKTNGYDFFCPNEDLLWHLYHHSMPYHWSDHRDTQQKQAGDRFEVTAVCEEVAIRAQQACRDFSAMKMDGVRALAARSDVDAILMMCPQWFGPLPIFAACDEGKAVYCAAALDLQLEQAQHLKRRVEEAGIAFMAALPKPFSLV